MMCALQHKGTGEAGLLGWKASVPDHESSRLFLCSYTFLNISDIVYCSPAQRPHSVSVVGFVLLFTVYGSSTSFRQEKNIMLVLLQLFQ